MSRLTLCENSLEVINKRDEMRIHFTRICNNKTIFRKKVPFKLGEKSVSYGTFLLQCRKKVLYQGLDSTSVADEKHGAMKNYITYMKQLRNNANLC